MSAIEVLARALHESATRDYGGDSWEKMRNVQQDAWRAQAEVIAARMIEAEPPCPPVSDIVPPSDLVTAMGAFTEAAERMLQQGVPKDMDPADAVRVLDRIRYGIDQAKFLDSNLVTLIYLRHEHGDTVYDGIGQVGVYRTKDRKSWDVRGVVQAVLDKRMEARGGEMPNDPWEVAEWLLEVLPGGDPRLTPLRGLGLNPEAFHTVKPGNPTVSFPPRT